MRPIIFRGKDVKTGEWHQGGFTLDAAGHPRIITISKDGEGLVFNNVIPETVGQFTGLSDNNEVDVCEGDEIIGVCILTDANGYDTRFDVHGVVKYSDDFSGLIFTETVKTPVENYGSFMYQLEYFKVIGNIHDNKDLLKD